MSEHDPTMPVGEALRRVQAEVADLTERISGTTFPSASGARLVNWRDSLAVLIRVVELSDNAVLAWDCLQSYKGDEMHKPIDAFRATIGALRQALASGPGPQQEKS